MSANNQQRLAAGLNIEGISLPLVAECRTTTPTSGASPLMTSGAESTIVGGSEEGTHNSPTLSTLCLLANGSDYFSKMAAENYSPTTVTDEDLLLTMTSDAGIPQLPGEMTFNENGLISVVSYSVLLVIGGLGNLMVFMTLFRNRHRRSRVNRFIMHLSVADMIVTFVMMPLEIGWHLTVSWQAGDASCRALMFFRAFGFYLSSFILVSISLDRYFAIARPLSLTDANHRGSLMLVLAWIFSVIASIPQVRQEFSIISKRTRT